MQEKSNNKQVKRARRKIPDKVTVVVDEWLQNFELRQISAFKKDFARELLELTGEAFSPDDLYQYAWRRRKQKAPKMCVHSIDIPTVPNSPDRPTLAELLCPENKNEEAITVLKEIGELIQDAIKLLEK